MSLFNIKPRRQSYRGVHKIKNSGNVPQSGSRVFSAVFDIMISYRNVLITSFLLLVTFYFAFVVFLNGNTVITVR